MYKIIEILKQCNLILSKYSHNHKIWLYYVVNIYNHLQYLLIRINRFTFTFFIKLKIKNVVSYSSYCLWLANTQEKTFVYLIVLSGSVTECLSQYIIKVWISRIPCYCYCRSVTETFLGWWNRPLYNLSFLQLCIF